QNTSLVNVDVKNALLTFVYRHNKSVSYHPEIQYDRHETFFYKCDCGVTASMCTHVGASFLLLQQTSGNNYFYKFKNHDDAKNMLLKPYGLTIADKEAADIEFNINQ